MKGLPVVEDYAEENDDEQQMVGESMIIEKLLSSIASDPVLTTQEH